MNTTATLLNEPVEVLTNQILIAGAGMIQAGDKAGTAMARDLLAHLRSPWAGLPTRTVIQRSWEFINLYGWAWSRQDARKKLTEVLRQFEQDWFRVAREANVSAVRLETALTRLLTEAEKDKNQVFAVVLHDMIRSVSSDLSRPFQRVLDEATAVFKLNLPVLEGEDVTLIEQVLVDGRKVGETA